MIEKNIYYCWFGKNQMPDYAQINIENWSNLMPSFNIFEINEDNFPTDYNAYVSNNYRNKKYAFVSDVARLYYLYHFGGIYLDTDVEMKKPLDGFLKHDELVLSMERYEREITGICAGTIIVQAHNPFLAKILDLYNSYRNMETIKKDVTINEIFNNALKTMGLKFKNIEQIFPGIHIYPCEYFCIDSKLSYTVHHYQKFELNNLSKFRKVRRIIGRNVKRIIGRDIFEALWERRN